jgi:hypothetical protein
MYTLDDLIRECSSISQLDARKSRTASSQRSAVEGNILNSDCMAYFNNSSSESTFYSVWMALMDFIYEHLA